MKINQTEFQQQLKIGSLRLCFVGMSNIGKSHLSHLLIQSLNFENYEVDDQIQQAMSLSDIGSSANWMGYPYDERYPSNVSTYLTLEEEKTLAAPININKNLVLDTTGSVIYLDKKVHQWLKEYFLIVNFDCPDSMKDSMTENFFAHPKPVVWGESYAPEPNESGPEALKRCYPQLLADRTAKYRSLADITIPGEVTRHPGVSAERVLDLIALNLSPAL